MTRVPILELADATVVKDDRPVLHRLSLTIRDGEHTAILGPNGAGKSTLIGRLTHVERPLARDEGDPAVRVFGRVPGCASRFSRTALPRRAVSPRSSRRSRNLP